jgi:hypothetical protein
MKDRRGSYRWRIVREKGWYVPAIHGRGPEEAEGQDVPGRRWRNTLGGGSRD